MLDPRRLRTDLDALRAAVARRGVDTTDLDRAAALDVLQRERARQRDDVRARVKALSKQVGEARRGGDEATAERLSAESRSLGEDEKRLDAEAEAAARELR
ncbi:MAG: serine--tRNA ligase, partial [Actinobacteria bacterium]